MPETVKTAPQVSPRTQERRDRRRFRQDLLRGALEAERYFSLEELEAHAAELRAIENARQGVN